MSGVGDSADRTLRLTFRPQGSDGADIAQFVLFPHNEQERDRDAVIRIGVQTGGRCREDPDEIAFPDGPDGVPQITLHVRVDRAGSGNLADEEAPGIQSQKKRRCPQRQLFGHGERPGVAGAVDQHEGFHFVGVIKGNFLRDVSAHRLPDDGRAFDSFACQDGEHVVHQQGDADSPAQRPGAAVSAGVPKQKAVAVFHRRQLLLEHAVIGAGAMQEDEPRPLRFRRDPIVDFAGVLLQRFFQQTHPRSAPLPAHAGLSSLAYIHFRIFAKPVRRKWGFSFSGEQGGVGVDFKSRWPQSAPFLIDRPSTWLELSKNFGTTVTK